MNNFVDKFVESFTLADLSEGHIEYIQLRTEGVEPQMEILRLYATDGMNTSPTEQLKIQIEVCVFNLYISQYKV